MQTFAQKPKATPRITAANSNKPGRAHFPQGREVSPVLHLRRTIGNHSLQRMLPLHPEKPTAGLTGTASPHQV